MKNWSKGDFTTEAEKLSSAFVAGFQNGGASINELLVKSAKDNCLNSEQIARLTRLTNVQTFNLLHKTKEAGDQYVEYPLGDENHVIAQLHPTKEASASRSDFPDLPDEIESHRPGRLGPAPKEPIQKIASDIDELLGPKERPDIEYMKWQKVAENLKSRMGQSEIRWEVEMRSLKDGSKFASWNHDEFEKTALALYGPDSIPELNSLRDELGIKDKLSVSSEKVAFLQDRLVPKVSRYTESLGRAIEARKGYLKNMAGQKVAAERAENYRKMIHV